MHKHGNLKITELFKSNGMAYDDMIYLEQYIKRAVVIDNLEYS